MKTMLDIDDRLIRAAKARGAQDGETLTRLVERALCDYLQSPHGPHCSFRAELLTKRGRTVVGVNLDDRDMLNERMDAPD